MCRASSQGTIMAAFDFKPMALAPRDTVEYTPFDTSAFAQFADYSFGVYATEWDDSGEPVKSIERNPYTGHMYSPNRLETGLRIEEAAAQIDKLRSMGDQRELGLILYMPSDLVCVDFDDTESPTTRTEVHAAHMGILKSSQTWIEKSVSGVGYHAFYRLTPAQNSLLTNTNNHDRQIDTRVVNGFVFLTGKVMKSAPIAPFDHIQREFRDYLYQRCAVAMEASSGSSAKWSETAEHSDIDVIKALFKRYPRSADFLFTRQDQSGNSELHFQAVCDLIRCSLNYEQVKSVYLASECAEFEYRSENRNGMSKPQYEKWLTRNINGAAQELTDSGRFFNPDDIFIGFDEEASTDFETNWSDDVTDYTPTSWIVQDVIPSQGVVSVFGPSGSGKTFLTLDMLSAISCGNDWFGKRTKSVPVTYVGLEGAAGLRNRIYAYRQAHGDVGKMMMITDSMNITKSEDVQKLLRAMTKNDQMGGILVIDTMSKSAPGMDENASSEMSTYIHAIEDLARQTYGVVLLVHHSGKDTDRGPRGHSSFLAALDAAIEVSRVPESDNRQWSTKKVKDGGDDVCEEFVLEAVEIGVDQWGAPAHSCVVRKAEKPNLDGMLGANVITDDDCKHLCALMNSSGVEQFSAKKGAGSVYSMLHEYQGWPPSWDSKRTQIVVEQCIARDFIEEYDYLDDNRNRKVCLRAVI